MLILNSQWYVANWQHTCAFVSIYCMFLLLLRVILGKLCTPPALIQDSVAKMVLIKYFSRHANIICIKSDIKFAESVFEMQFQLWCSFYGTYVLRPNQDIVLKPYIFSQNMSNIKKYLIIFLCLH